LSGSSNGLLSTWLLPDGYQEEPTRRYPVLYLLEVTGGSANCVDASCSRLAPFLAFLSKQRVITVMPYSGGLASYPDWRDGSSPNETLFVEKLLPYVDAHYRTIPNRSHRAIAGISAGGYGAMLLTARHPDLFSAAAAFSGVVDIEFREGIGRFFFGGTEGGFATLDGDTDDPFAIWGNPVTDPEGWRRSNPAALAERLRETSVHLATGTGTPCGPEEANEYLGLQIALERVVYETNLSFHAALDRAQVEHTFLERCGAHNGFAMGTWLRDFESWFSAALPSTWSTKRKAAR
jgi:diacylglycerol O-acyltransferase/trehalose O-mycolyltransferase